MVVSATPSIDEIINVIDAGMNEFMNQKLCDSDKVTNVLLDIRNLVILTNPLDASEN